MNATLNKSICVLLCAVMLASTGAMNVSAGLPSAQDASKTIRVSTTGSDATGCGDGILPPCKSIQYAVNLAVSGDTILVAAGAYKYNSIDPCNALSNRSVVCYWDKQLTILGGYSDANWNTADPVANLTVIDGESLYRGVAILGISAPTSLSMEGITIQNSRAVGKPAGATYAGHAFGAGMWASKSFVNLKNMAFKNNIAAGGSSMNIASAGWAFGGGLAIEGPSSGISMLEKITFSGNQALGGSGSTSGGNSEGGGFFAGEAAVTATEITLTNNIAKGGDTPGNACPIPGSGYGGAVALTKHASLQLSHFTVTDNQAIGSNAAGSNSCGGSGIGAAFWFENATIHINDSLIQANRATGGVGTSGGIGWAGGIYTEKANLILERVKVIANTATSGGSSGSGQAGTVGGGGAYLSAWDGANYSSSMTNCLFADNKAVMGVPGSTRNGAGGAIYILGTAADITHSTFVNNQLENGPSLGQGIIVNAAPIAGGSKPGSLNLKYSVVTDHRNTYPYNNSAIEIFLGSGSLSYVWFGNNTSDMKLPAGTPTDHLTTSLSSAGYMDPSTYDYHLQADSPVIDGATNSTTTLDLDRVDRPVGLAPDLGAYEYSGPTLEIEKPVLYLMTDTDDEISLTTPVSVNTGPETEWEASTSLDWVYLGATGTSQHTTGHTGDDLTIRLDPSRIPLASYVATVNIASNEANPTVITVNFFKVDEVAMIYLPGILK